MNNIAEKEGKVFNIQGYSIHDGPGIRTTVFLSGCPLRCLWCQNPESNTMDAKLFFLSEKCVGCGRCIPVCPNGAIHMTDEGRVANDRTKCTACGACVKVCPVDAREISGEVMTAGDVVKRVMKDKIFYDTSGGGVTVSGGEVLAQSDFTAAILQLSKENGLHTTIETCGFGSWENFMKFLPYTDLVLYDIKHFDSEEHKKGTGFGNELILENAKRIRQELHLPMAVRIPTITGFNDNFANMGATANFVVKELGTDVKVHLLPYHRLGNSKHERMEDDITFTADIPTDEHMEELRAYVESFGLQAQIGG